MTDETPDLTHEERQTAARLESLIARVRASSPSDAPIDELWPDIRSRIEAAKVSPLASPTLPPDRTARRRRTMIGATLVAAAALVVALLPILPGPFSRTHTPQAPAVPLPPESSALPSTGPTLISVTDSERVYAEETRLLLNRLELERSMLRPETARVLDRDLRVIDQAIAELKTAIAHDPRNPALHQLLASSYRQKAELLKRVANTG
jgi:hypothetical protein